MFMHRDRGSYARAVSLGLLTALSTRTVAQAAPSADPFVLAAHSNRSGGQPLVSGDYTSAAQALDTNRCVAYAMTRQLTRARAACDAAVHEARSPDSVLLQRNPQLRQQARSCPAVAHSSGAVLQLLSSDPAAALARRASFVARNLVAINAHQNLTSQTTATATAAAARE